MQPDTPLIIIGAGPAGLSAAYEATQRGLKPLVLEKSVLLGGMARTEMHHGYRWDIGGHRFFTKVAEIQELWQALLGVDLLTVSRVSHIYYKGRFFNYPLDFLNAFWNLGPRESLLAFLSYLQAKIHPYLQEDTFEQWVSNRFGRRLFRIFFQGYTEKVWGMPCDQIQAEWAAQRIKGLSLRTAIADTLFGSQHIKTLAQQFYYPRLGSGMLWERLAQVATVQGAEVWLQSEVIALAHDGGHMTHVVVKHGEDIHTLPVGAVISSMPFSELLLCLNPTPPTPVIQAARGLRYRDFILVGLIIRRAHVLADNWLYVQSTDVTVGRIQNYKNWSTAMTPDPEKTSLGLEYFCTRGDALWQQSDASLIALAIRELETLGLARADEVEDGLVIRQPLAYPVYDAEYRTHLETLRGFLATLDNVQTVGRNGMHYYNNQDHSMLTGILAVRNLFGEQHNLWNISADDAYYEELEID